MKWIITRDLINHNDRGPAYAHLPDTAAMPTNKVGRGFLNGQFFERAIDPKDIKAAADAMGTEFRLLDDDGEVYFEGRCKGLENASGDEAFAPLDEVGAAFGCTAMQYRQVGATDWSYL